MRFGDGFWCSWKVRMEILVYCDFENVGGAPSRPTEDRDGLVIG